MMALALSPVVVLLCKAIIVIGFSAFGALVGLANAFFDGPGVDERVYTTIGGLIGAMVGTGLVLVI